MCQFYWRLSLFERRRFVIRKNLENSHFNRRGYKIGIQNFQRKFSDVFGVGRSDGVSGLRNYGDVIRPACGFDRMRSADGFLEARPDTKTDWFALIHVKTCFLMRKTDGFGGWTLDTLSAYLKKILPAMRPACRFPLCPARRVWGWQRGSGSVMGFQNTLPYPTFPHLK